VSTRGRDHADPTRAPCFEHGDEPQWNLSLDRTSHDVLEARLGRRDVMFGGLAAAATAVYCAGFAPAQRAEAAVSRLFGFEPGTTGEAGPATAPKGHRVRILLPRGQPLASADPALSDDDTGAEQERQIGPHHDGIHFLPIGGASTDGPIDDAPLGGAGVIEAAVAGPEDAVRQLVVADGPPEVLDGVRLGRTWRQGHEGDIGRRGELRADVPPGLIERQHGVG
jgi:hypothetical protein